MKQAKHLSRTIVLFLSLITIFTTHVSGKTGREKYNFNSEWLLHIGDLSNGQDKNLKDSGKEWKQVTLPRAFNEDEAFKLSIEQLTDTIVWYRKHFRIPNGSNGKKVFVEFEGVRQAADFYINGHHLGLHENGVMAVGFDLTPYVNPKGDNVIALRIDNDWDYRERATNTKFQWSNRNFNVNYGGIPKNVWLHITEPLYQTLPLYSNLRTTGVYIYAKNFDIENKQADIHAESEVRNESKQAQTFNYEVVITNADGKEVATFSGDKLTVQPGETRMVKASKTLNGLHFWSWGYGYLYTVKTRLVINNRISDEVVTRTGFRKTRFAEGKIWLNDRVIQMKGYAQRTSNEWPGVGMSVPAWLSDYSNDLMVKSNANLVRWMHVTPWKQDVESCDRVGLIQAMPAGDAEKDREGRQWEQRTELMRDAVIYNRNNPSILFYESGNESVSEPHILEMKAIRNRYDPYGGRAVGSREMLDIRTSEYGGEMLYINKSAHHPMWAMEYCRNEGLRKYWDEESYPYHKEGAGPLYRDKDASEYNHNQDKFTVELIRRWYDYWRERPGTGTRVSSGGVKIIFSDTNTHYRGEENYRRSGVTDAMRIEKDGFFAHQVMWNGWVESDTPQTYIVGHWNYKSGTEKSVYVVSNGERVELFLNGHSLGAGEQEYRFLFTFPQVRFKEGTLEAISYNAQGEKVSSYRLQTAGEPASIRLNVLQSPNGLIADGADLVLAEVEVIDSEGRRCPLDNRIIDFTLEGPAEWRGGIAQGSDNYILSTSLPVECGINRALIRSTTKAGNIKLTARAEGLPDATVSFTSSPIAVKNGLSTYIPGDELPCLLARGETPKGASYRDTKTGVPVLSATAGANTDKTELSYDDNELSEWSNDGRLNTAWITYRLTRDALIDDICIKLTGWRMRSYPLEIYAGEELIWEGETEKSLGYIHLPVKPVKTDEITIRLKGSITEEDAFGQITELDPGQELDLYKDPNASETKGQLRIVEIEFLESL